MIRIPKIIHQVWSDKHQPLPSFYSILAETWKEKHLDWEYILWNEKMMDEFVKNEYPHYYNSYMDLPFDIQRWDMIRFLILKKRGGLYIDTDYECLENIEPLLENVSFAIGLDPESYYHVVNYTKILNHAIMASIPDHPFLDKVINEILTKKYIVSEPINKVMYVLATTGPRKMSELYAGLNEEEKSQLTLLASKHVTPFDGDQIKMIQAGVENEELEACLKEAYAVHYFSNSWF